MIVNTNAWLGGAFWHNRDVSIFDFQQARKKKQTPAAFTLWLWPGAGEGVRGPMQDETPLSLAEVKYIDGTLANTKRAIAHEETDAMFVKWDIETKQKLGQV